MSTNILNLAKQLKQQQLTFTCAESCTGGLIAKICTDLEGSSAWFDRGFVTYSNHSKIEMLGVETSTLEKHGAVSEQVVRQMVDGAINNSHAQTAIAVTGIAGPTGGSKEKPVGTVWVGIAIDKEETKTQCLQLTGTRESIREQTAEFSINWLNGILKQK